MTISGIPPHLWEKAALLPQNAHAKEALQRLAGTGAVTAPTAPADVAQKGTSKPGKRRGEPNGTEARFAREILDPMVARGELDSYECEGMTLRIVGVGAVTPDYVGWHNGVPELFEVKAHQIHESTVLRMKVHAAARPWLRWRIYARRDGAWRVHFDSR